MASKKIRARKMARAAVKSRTKSKTSKTAAKRFWKSTASGKIRRAKGRHGHFLSKRGQKARETTGTTLVHETNFDQVNRMLPGLKAKRKRTKYLASKAKKAVQTTAQTKA